MRRRLAHSFEERVLVRHPAQLRKSAIELVHAHQALEAEVVMYAEPDGMQVVERTTQSYDVSPVEVIASIAKLFSDEPTDKRQLAVEGAQVGRGRLLEALQVLGLRQGADEVLASGESLTPPGQKVGPSARSGG